jgi:hypothetical protein
VISVSATDNTGVTKVEMYIDGLLSGTDTTAAYSFSFDTRTLTNGYHTILVKAADGAGNSAAKSISVKVVG